ncbi:MAG: hypothetical protein U9N86_06970 [Bacteroidota bacterium]|nr:hypothetical protein [Bacteroidota bacterium]
MKFFILKFVLILALFNLTSCESMIKKLLEYDELEDCVGESALVELQIDAPFDNVEMAYLKYYFDDGLYFYMSREVQNVCVDSKPQVSYRVLLKRKLLEENNVPRPTIYFGVAGGNHWGYSDGSQDGDYFLYTRTFDNRLDWKDNDPKFYEPLMANIEIYLDDISVKEALEDVIMEMSIKIEYEY